MLLRRCTAIALLGWYLMVPPIAPSETQGSHLDSEAPLSVWTIQHSFDTAIQCKRSLEKWRAELHRPDKSKLGVQEIQMRSAARCVATDDPRLGGK